ncbi:hypothetical protein M9Y10_029601 [Tritrichomonas musculus]|uniref:Uncharacterized protein n=1 Tax=Tritrichomonas musculus TaxID=1915356 RepID=A0ABR2KMN8_9EUKA
MDSSSSVIIQDDGPFQYLEIRDFQSRLSELQRANLNLKMLLIEQENRMTQILIDGNVDQTVITEFIRNTRIIDDLNSQVRNLTSELEEAKEKISESNTKLVNQKEVERELRNEIQSLRATNQLYENNDQSFDSNSSKSSISLRFEISKLKQEIATQEARNAELTIEIVNLQSRLNDYENDEKENDSEVSRIKRLLNETRNDLTQAKEENFQLRSEIASLNLSITEKNSQIEEKSKKIRLFKHVVQNNLNDTQLLKTKFNKKASLFQSHMDDFINSMNDRIQLSNERCTRIQKSITGSFNQAFIKSKKKYQEKTIQQSNIIHDLASLSAKLVNIPTSSIPEIDDLINNPSTLELFVNRITAAHEMQQSTIQSDLNKLEVEFRKNQNQKKNKLSSKVSNFMINIQGTLNNMTKTLHHDHLQLIDALSVSESEMSD